MSDPKPEQKVEKTYKRETAHAMLAVYFGLLIAGVWSEAAAEQAAALCPYAFTFAGLAFGMDAYSKQIK